ncbi:MAG: cysteine desulfurase-like protein [Chloroflexi bacterium]|nr:cysteine desulfurase-like protein [Chloroflexota bacterium]
MTIDISQIRAHFPALTDEQVIFLDNPGGTQICQQALDRVNAYLTQTNANRHGAFETSRASDQVLDEARAACKDFYNASRPEEIIFGSNMTSLTLHLSRSLAHLLEPGDQIVVTRLDHDANITPWTLIAAERGCEVEWVDFDVEEGTLNMESLARALEKRPRLAAVGYASNALGTINPIQKITRMAKEAGALVYVDAVQYAPHGIIDVQKLGCDFLVSSAYKWFSTHVGMLYGRYELLEGLKAYKVRPAPNDPPGKWETGTANHEGIAGVLGAMEYFEWIGEQFGGDHLARYQEDFSGRALRLRQGMAAIKAYEFEINRALLDVLTSIPEVTIYGLTDVRRLDERVPTFSINLDGFHPRQLAEELGRRGIYVWDGNYYALAVTQRLGVEDSGGMLRIGAVHYNTVEEVYRLGDALREIIVVTI